MTSAAEHIRIAAHAKVDLPFVMAMQTARLLAVIAIGPPLARASARWAERKTAAVPTST